MRNEKPAELVGDLVERGLEVRDTVEGLRIFGASSFRPRRSTVNKESRRKAKRSIIGRAVMSDAAKVASRGTYTSTLNELMYRNWSSIGGVRYTVPRSTLCNSATAMSTFTKFTHARITQCFLVRRCFHALCKRFVAGEIPPCSSCKRPSGSAPSAAGSTNWGS